MRAIIPVAGNGTRLSPITKYKAKVLVEVAGRPVLAHILDNLSDSDVDEVVMVVGHKRQQIIEWTHNNYRDRFEFHFVHQKQTLGLGHAIYCARNYLDSEETVILLGDVIFSSPYSGMLKDARASGKSSGALGIKFVDNPRYYGMVKIGENELVESMVEKPREFESRSAIAGIYYLREGESLLDSLEYIMGSRKTRGEYQLTDALQNMVSNGTAFSVFRVGDWYDCGRLETLISSNRQLLEKSHHIDKSSEIRNCEIVGPCIIGPESCVTDSRIGPYVSIGSNASVSNCTLEDIILESASHMENSTQSYGVVSKDTQLFRYI